MEEKVSRRRVLKVGAGAVSGLALGQIANASSQGPKRIYLAPDDHTDYLWIANEETYRLSFLDMLDYRLALTNSTMTNPSDAQGRWNCDGSLWMWTYEKNRSLADFEGNFIAAIRSGHLSVPLTTTVGIYGGTPAEAILRGLYYAGRIERRYNLRFRLAVAMENQTLPYGLGSLWAGAGAKYSWRGVCNCATHVAQAYDRPHEIYWWTGPDGSRILMKWNSLYAKPVLDPAFSSYYTNLGEPYGAAAQDANENLGGYAEARYPFETVEFVDNDPGFKARWPYRVIGAFGEGWDSVSTKTSNFVSAAQIKSNTARRVIVSNETDFFEDFEGAYGVGLPEQALTFGNEWELCIASMQETSASVRRSVEKLRAAEAMQTLVLLKKPNYFDEANVQLNLTPGAASLPAGYGPFSDKDARDIAYLNLGLYYEHNFGFNYVTSIQERIDFNRRTAANIVNYVDHLYDKATTGLASLIQRRGSHERFFVFNQLSAARTEFVDYPYSGPAAVKVFDLSSGKPVLTQIVNVNGQRFLRIYAVSLPPLGYRVYDIQPGAAASTVAAQVNTTTRTIENEVFRIQLAADGAIQSLIDKRNGSRELVAQSPQPGRTQTARLNDLGRPTGTNFQSVCVAENVGPISATIRVTVSGGDAGYARTTAVTLTVGTSRVDIENTITDNFPDTKLWDFGFNLTNPEIWHEELGAVIQAKSSSEGGVYSDRNHRHDFQSLGHFVDLSEASGHGVTLSNRDCHFMKVGNSSIDQLDAHTTIVSPLAGGQLDSSVVNQAGDTKFTYRFALYPHKSLGKSVMMRNALCHNNPPAVGKLPSTAPAGDVYPESTLSLVSVSNPATLVWSLKPADDGISHGVVARLWNLEPTAQLTTVKLNGLSLKPVQTTHIETPIGTVSTSAALTASFNANEMRTYLFGP